MASIEDVARLANVSPITVSRVIRNEAYVSASTRERVQQAITELNYIPNAVARGLRQSRSGMIAFIITDISSPFYTAVAHGAADAARSHGLSLLFGNTAEVPDVERDHLRVVGERRVDGLIFAPSSARAVEDLHRLLPRDTPVVMFDRAFKGTPFDVVRCDTQSGVFALTSHLISLGHRRIAIVGGLPDVTTWQERVGGYVLALNHHGIEPLDELIVPGDYKRTGGASAICQLVASGTKPDAIIAGNSVVCLGVLDGLSERGLRVPEDIGVASIDDPMPKTPFWQRITVVEQPGYEMGRAAVDALARRLSSSNGGGEPQELVFDPELIVGVSCGEARQPG